MKDINPKDPSKAETRSERPRGLFARIARRLTNALRYSDRQLKDAETPVSWS